MRKFLLFLSVLVFSNVAVARTLVEIERKTTKGCKIVFIKNASRDEDKTSDKIEWTGACKGGYADGSGTVTATWSDGRIDKSVAIFRKGREEGVGSAESTRANGNKIFFRGVYSNGLPQGVGEFTIKAVNGTVIKYQGNFVDGMPEGQGRLETPQWVYSGEVRNMKPSGRGRFEYTNKVVYEGDVRDGKQNGNGKLVYPNGIRLSGYFIDGKLPASGRVDFPNGEIYEGQLENGQPHGKGRSVSADGTGYFGEFKAGKPEGDGAIQKSDGSRFPVSISNGQITRHQTEQEIAQAQNAERENVRRREQEQAYGQAVDACRARMANSVRPTNGNFGAILSAAAECNQNPGVQPPPQPTVVVVPSSPTNISCTRTGAFVNCNSY